LDVGVSPRKQCGVAGGVVVVGAAARPAVRWQEASIEGILTDVDADPGGRGGVFVVGYGVTPPTSRMRGSGMATRSLKMVSEVDDEGVMPRPARDLVPEVLGPLPLNTALSPANGRHP